MGNTFSWCNTQLTRYSHRRAKIKNIAKKHIETGDDYEAIPDSMRRYLAMQALESGKPLINDEFFGSSSSAYGNGAMLNADPNSSKVSKYCLQPLSTLSHLTF